jgi:hypothetical protein
MKKPSFCDGMKKADKYTFSDWLPKLGTVYNPTHLTIQHLSSLVAAGLKEFRFTFNSNWTSTGDHLEN